MPTFNRPVLIASQNSCEKLQRKRKIELDYPKTWTIYAVTISLSYPSTQLINLSIMVYVV